MKDVVAELRVGLKDLAAEDRTGWVPLGLSDRVRDLVGLSETMQVELVRGLAGWDRATAWAEDGAVTAVAWLKANTPLTGGEASGLVQVARLYAGHRCVADALDGGDLTLAKARLLARAETNREELVRRVCRRVRGAGPGPRATRTSIRSSTSGSNWSTTKPPATTASGAGSPPTPSAGPPTPTCSAPPMTPPSSGPPSKPSTPPTPPTAPKAPAVAPAAALRHRRRHLPPGPGRRARRRPHHPRQRRHHHRRRHRRRTPRRPRRASTSRTQPAGRPAGPLPGPRRR